MLRSRAVLLAMFCGSGAAALVYQTVWARSLHAVIGTTSGAIATVLAAFMAGLGAGGLLGGALAARTRRPLALWGGLELAIGTYALLFPRVVDLWMPFQVWVAGTLTGAPLYLLRFAWVAAALLPATIAMGATLPLLVRHVRAAPDQLGDRVGSLVSANTAGAVLGAAFSGFLLLPWIGLTATTRLAVAINLGLGVLALALSADASPPPEVARAPAGRWAAVVAFGGFAALAGEVAWTRVFALVLGPSVYAFAVMLVATLVGLAIGGKLGGWVADRVDPGRLPLLVASLRIGAGASSWLLLFAANQLPFWYVWAFDAVGGEDDIASGWAGCLVLSMIFLVPPALLSGAAFPAAVRATGSERTVGALAAASSLGGAFGAAITGFWLLSAWRVTGVVRLASAIDATGGAIAVGRRGWVVPALAAAVAFALVPPPWDDAVMTSGTYLYLSRFSDHSRAGILRGSVSDNMIFYSEGPSSVVTVGHNQKTGNLWLANNGKIDASSQGDKPTQVMVGMLPLQFLEQPDRVMVIGLASGMTAGSAGLVQGVHRLDVVELEPTMPGATRLFAEHNFGILDDPRLHLAFDDARSRLLVTPPGTYDAVISEPSNPWIAGVASLFTVDFLELGKTRLKPGGIWAQWIQVYGLDVEGLRTLLATFSAVYDHVLVFGMDDLADLVVVGSDRLIRPTLDDAARLYRSPAAAAALTSVGAPDPVDLVAMFEVDEDGLAPITADVARNTDDNVRIEYLAPLNLHRDTVDDNLRMIGQNSEVPRDAIGDYPERWVDLARAWIRREEPRRADEALRIALELLPEDDPRRADWQALRRSLR